MNLIKTWFYMGLNVFYFLFSKHWVDKKIKEYLSRKYNKNDTIIIAIHGVFEYYWQSFTRYMKYFDKKGKVIIPIHYDYTKSFDDATAKVKKQIQEIAKKTKCNIILIGNSSGGLVGAKYMIESKGKYVKEFIPVATFYSREGYGVFAKLIIAVLKEPYKNMPAHEKLLKQKIPKTKIEVYGSKDIFINRKKLIKKYIKKQIFPTGHFSILYSPEIIKFIYDYIFS
ncbi:WG repeat-containing protein [Candidatus Woesearchaeota archaeon]|nr:WG repeat-containing protein [Candidatus Woesearchaeota archaeon]